ncbi:MAG: protein kinase [Gemmatimonadaceae bacterium]
MTTPLDQLSLALTARYIIERELGAGGMAVVYLANDTKHHRQVAVKSLRPELAQSIGSERFLREIEIAAGLHHPHILPLHDSGGADGVLYYVMPFVDGQSLRDRMLKAGALPVDEAVRVLREVLDALAYSHGRGVVHRDIKPENILLSGTHALVTDFGIAKAISDANSATQLTSAGLAMGTPSYMAPEQISADPSLDHRADIYAVGIMAYEMLAGRTPFQGTTAQQILAGHLSRTPDALALHRPAISPALEAVVMRALEKNPADRWQSAAEMLTALELSVTGSTVATSAPAARGAKQTTPLDASRTRKHTRTLLGAGVAAVALAVVAGLWVTKVGRAGTLLGQDVLAQNDVVMVSEFQNRTADTTLAQTVTDAVRADLQQSHVVQVMAQSAMWAGIRRMKLSPDSVLSTEKVRELAEREGAKAYVTGDIARLGGGYVLTARVVATTGNAEPLIVKATASDDSKLIAAVQELGHNLRKGIGESLRSVSQAPPLAQVTTASLPALRLFTASKRAVNNGEAVRAVTLANEALVLDSAFASAWSVLFVAYSNMNEVAKASDAVTHAYALSDRLSEVDALLTKARYHSMRGEFDEGDAAWQRLVEMNLQHTNYANQLLARRRFVDAEVVQRKGVELDPKLSIGYWNLAEAQIAQRHFAAAESTATLMSKNLPDLRLTQQTIVGIPLAERDFDKVITFLATPGGKRLDSEMPQYACAVDIARGRVQSATKCTLSMERVGFKEVAVLAEFRLTEDTILARQGYSAFLAKKPEERSLDTYAVTIAILAEVGKIREARQLYEEWRTRAGTNAPSFRGDSSYAVGAIAAAEGQWEKAANAFLDWNRAPFVSSAHFYNQGLAEAATALQRLNKSDSARVLLERALQSPSLALGWVYELTWYSQALQKLGDIYAERGDRAKAAEYYEKYVALMKDAEAPVTTQVAQVRKKLEALSGDAGVKATEIKKR